MNSSLEPPRTVVFALCGSFCTFETVLPQIIRLRACGWEVLPMLSYAASALDTRFGRAADWKQRLEEATGHRPLEDLREAEPLGPKHMAQALVIAPCTGTTMALLAAGISATPVTLAAKSMLRGGRLGCIISSEINRAAGCTGRCRQAGGDRGIHQRWAFRQRGSAGGAAAAQKLLFHSLWPGRQLQKALQPESGFYPAAGYAGSRSARGAAAADFAVKPVEQSCFVRVRHMIEKGALVWEQRGAVRQWNISK